MHLIDGVRLELRLLLRRLVRCDDGSNVLLGLQCGGGALFFHFVDCIGAIGELLECGYGDLVLCWLSTTQRIGEAWRVCLCGAAR